MKIVLTKSAKKSYFDTIENLLFYWNKSIAEDFIDLTEQLFNILETNPYCFPKYLKNDTYYKAKIHKNVSVFYKVNENEIVVHLFWNNRKNPKKLTKYLP